MDPAIRLQIAVAQTWCGVIPFPDEGFFVSMESTTAFEWLGWLDVFDDDFVFDALLLGLAEGLAVCVPAALDSGVAPTPTGSTEDDTWSTGTTFPTSAMMSVSGCYINSTTMPTIMYSQNTRCTIKFLSFTKKNNIYNKWYDDELWYKGA